MKITFAKPCMSGEKLGYLIRGSFPLAQMELD